MLEQEPEFTTVRKPGGGFETVPTSQLGSGGATPARGLEALGAYIDLRAAGLGVSKTQHTDSYKIGPFNFRIRAVGKAVRLHDDDFVNYAIKQLGLETFAEKFQDFSVFPDPAKARQEAARQIYVTEAFRVDNPELSTRMDELVIERYETLLLGLEGENIDTEKPDTWGGLVNWTVDNVAPDAFPFSPENVRRLTLPIKSQLYDRILTYSRAGVSDAQFRRSRGQTT
ncbi:hypothetical protein IAD21_00887 [Abditibacteriota bacterium]|nr:hypothetical protein IAD21_00887 [Abditibacteriota bacterium]